MKNLIFAIALTLLALPILNGPAGDDQTKGDQSKMHMMVRDPGGGL